VPYKNVRDLRKERKKTKDGRKHLDPVELLFLAKLISSSEIQSQQQDS
jgi:hypothetical protein